MSQTGILVSEAFCHNMPKVELHVHLEGSIRPETLLKLALRHNVALPANDVAGLNEWYRFRDFPHFVEIYVAVSQCFRTPDDIELVAREFLDGQAAHNVLHSEVTYTASTIEKYAGIPWCEQHAALMRARDYGQQELGITMNLIVDIVRGDPPERAVEVAKWCVGAEGVCALGLAGEERLGSTQYEAAFAVAREADLPIVPHAGETKGADSIWEVLDLCQPPRIGHGVRAIEDRRLMAELASRGVVLEVCPTSNVALGVFPSLADHSLPALLDEGISITLNSDDPPMFGTTISDEYSRCARAFSLDEDTMWSLCLNAANAALLTPDRRRDLIAKMRSAWPN